MLEPERRTDLAERVAILERELRYLRNDFRTASRQVGLELRRIEETVSEMAQKDAIAEAVSERIKADRAERWAWLNRPVKVTAAALGIAVSACAVAGFVIQVWP